MKLFLKHFVVLLALGLMSSLIFSCSKKKEEAPITEDEMLPKEDIDLLEEPELESLDNDSMTASLLEEEGMDALTEEKLDISDDDATDQLITQKQNLIKGSEHSSKKTIETKEPVSKLAPVKTMPVHKSKDEKTVSPSQVTKEKNSSSSNRKSNVSNLSESSLGKGDYVVQISIFKSLSGAKQLVNKLKEQGFPGYVSAVENPTSELSGTYYRVRIGSFSSIIEGKKFGENSLVPLGYDFWVDLKTSNEGSAAPSPTSKTKTAAPKAAVIPKPVTDPVQKPVPKPVEEPKTLTAPPQPPAIETLDTNKPAAPINSPTPAAPTTPAVKEPAIENDWGSTESEWGEEGKIGGEDTTSEPAQDEWK